MAHAPFRQVALAAVLPGAIAIGACATAPNGHEGSAPPVSNLSSANHEAMIAGLIDAHNRERSKWGRRPLTPNALLTAAAQRHARDMAERRVMSHKGGDGSSLRTRLTRVSYRFQAAGENVAAGQPTTADVMRSWMRSPPHRRNILGNYTQIGAACATAADGTTYWCVDFGRPWHGYQDPVELPNIPVVDAELAP